MNDSRKQAGYDAVWAMGLTDSAHVNALIWRRVDAALDAALAVVETPDPTVEYRIRVEKTYRDSRKAYLDSIHTTDPSMAQRLLAVNRHADSVAYFVSDAWIERRSVAGWVRLSDNDLQEMR